MNKTRLVLVGAGVLWTVAGVPVWGEGSVRVARADTPDLEAAMPRLPVAGEIPVFKVARGGRITLPMKNVSRVEPDDDDVARGSFSEGRAVLEGVTIGQTTVAVTTRDNQRQIVAVQVVASATPPAIVPAPQTDAAPLINPNTPSTVTPPSDSTPERAPQLQVSLSLETPQDNRAQALVTVLYANRGDDARNVLVRYVLDDNVSYVPGSATDDGKFDPSARELTWQIGNVNKGATGQVRFRVAPLDASVPSFNAAASIEDATGIAVISESRTFYFGATPLVAVFALPDRLVQSRNVPEIVDIAQPEVRNAANKLVRNGVATGEGPGRFGPNRATQRAEYVVMSLNGVNASALRDTSTIKFILGRRSIVDLTVRDANNRVVMSLFKGTTLDAGEHSREWDGMGSDGRYVKAGTYTYDCSARDSARGQVVRLQGQITVVPQTPLQPVGTPTFTDVKSRDWYAGYLAIAEKQNLVRGYPDNSFRPQQPISRVEATVIAVRALGLESQAKALGESDTFFLDYEKIPKYAVGYVNVATTRTKTQNGTLVRGFPGNFFLPLKNLRRDEAATMVSRLIERAAPRKIVGSGQMANGSVASIDGQKVSVDNQGRFAFTYEAGSMSAMTFLSSGN